MRTRILSDDVQPSIPHPQPRRLPRVRFSTHALPAGKDRGYTYSLSIENGVAVLLLFDQRRENDYKFHERPLELVIPMKVVFFRRTKKRHGKSSPEAETNVVSR